MRLRPGWSFIILLLVSPDDDAAEDADKTRNRLNRNERKIQSEGEMGRQSSLFIPPPSDVTNREVPQCTYKLDN